MGSPSKKGKERGGDDFPSERRIVKAVYAFAASARADGSAEWVSPALCCTSLSPTLGMHGQ